MPEETLRENKMGTMPENKLLLSMAVPMMISMLVQALYNICLLYTSDPAICLKMRSLPA